MISASQKLLSNHFAMLSDDENIRFKRNTSSDLNPGERHSEVGLRAPDPESLPLFDEFNEAPVGCSGDPAGDPPVAPPGDPFVDLLDDPPVAPPGDPFVDLLRVPPGEAFVDLLDDALGDPLRDPLASPLVAPPGEAFAVPPGEAFAAPQGEAFVAPHGEAFVAPLYHLVRDPHGEPLGVLAPAEGEDPAPVEAEEKKERAVWGTGIEAKKLRAVNVKSPEVVSYKKAVENLAGRLHVPKLQGVSDLVRDRYHVSVGRVGRRGQWSLWAYFKKQFADPADFVAFLQSSQ